MKFPKLSKDPEILFLIQPVSDSYKERLEEFIVDNGCPDSITIWDDTIIDGHLRYEICTEWEIPFRIENVEFENKSDAVVYVCKKQISRSDLTSEYRKYLLGKLFIAKCALERSRYPINSDSLLQNQGFRTTDISYKLAKEFNISSGTIQKYYAYAKAIDKIKGKSEELSKTILMNRLKISHENTITLSSISDLDTTFLNGYLKENDINHITEHDIWGILNFRQAKKTLPKITPVKEPEQPKIRTIPKYDPEASLSVLKYTSASWIDSINRAIEKTEFDKISNTTKIVLIDNLNSVIRSINAIKKLLGEEDYDARKE